MSLLFWILIGLAIALTLWIGVSIAVLAYALHETDEEEIK